MKSTARTHLPIAAAIFLFMSSVVILEAKPGIDNAGIDITGSRLQLRAVAPDRETGKPVEVTLPAGIPIGDQGRVSHILARYLGARLIHRRGFITRVKANSENEEV